MGWTYTKGATRADIVAARCRSWSADGGQDVCLAHALTQEGGQYVLWQLRERTGASEHNGRWIACDLLDDYPGYGWGYKDMAEGYHPYYWSCPIRFLDQAPVVVCQAWRDEVRQRHAERTRRHPPLPLGGDFGGAETATGAIVSDADPGL